MSEPIATVARIAATPEQAKIFVAMLQAEGIPARIEGDSLADEVAVSRRLMNLGGTRVLVPTASLQQAREILDVGDVDAEELAAQALAAEHGEVPPLPRPAATPRATPWLLLGSIGLAALFLALWLTNVDARSKGDPLLRYEPTANGMDELRAADGALLAEYRDADRDGHYEQVTAVAADGTRSELRDKDLDCRYESMVERRGALTYSWLDTDGDGLTDVCTVTDASGKQLQELRYVPGAGFALR
ncbi:MAG TPA: hypothetical protein VFZ65_17735 [Planctomycetota bacterium]|nr:hypothetical protein [Planctomycetota bacterium]